MKKVLIVYHSGYGHTAFAAQKVAEGVKKNELVEVELLEVGKTPTNLDLIKAADAIIFGAPTYMGTVSAGFKTFMDESSAAWMKREWEYKLAAGFTTSGSPSGDKLATLQTISTFAFQHGMIWVGYNRLPEVYSGVPYEEARNRLGSFTGLMLQAAQVAPEESFVKGDIASAIEFGEQIANVLTQKFK
jgi:NAD(P)H dehydrogenase (quinone)